MLSAHRAVIAFVILSIATAFSISKIYADERKLCAESHRRFDSITALIYVQTRPRLVNDYTSLRAKELATLGDEPSC